jgi:hypothetical protein
LESEGSKAYSKEPKKYVKEIGLSNTLSRRWGLKDALEKKLCQKHYVKQIGLNNTLSENEGSKVHLKGDSFKDVVQKLVT